MIEFRSTTGIRPHLSDWLDLARGLAACEVLAFHSYQLLFQEQVPGPSYGNAAVQAYSVLWALSGHGVAAVIVFFVLSGYLVGGPALVRARNGHLNAADYFSARLSRLYVVLIPALVVSFVFYMSAVHSIGWQSFVNSRATLLAASGLFSAGTGAASAICNGAFLQTIVCAPYAGNLALWSLSNEFWYYVLIFALISVRRAPAWALVIAAIIALFMQAEHADVRGFHTGLKFIFYFLIWVSGAIVYSLVAPFMVWMSGLLLSFAGIYLLNSKGLMPEWAAYHLTIGLLTGAAILALEATRLRLPSILRFASQSAKWSFSLYAIHYPILEFLNVTIAAEHRDFTVSSFALNAGFILCCLAAALVFYFLFESRTDIVRDRIRRLIWLQSKPQLSAVRLDQTGTPP